MRIVLWIGNEANQRALANKVASTYQVVGIVAESRRQKRKHSFRRMTGKVFERVFLSSIDEAWKGMKRHYARNYPVYPDTELLHVENINVPSVDEFTRRLDPDLILVSGTGLIREHLLSIRPKVGILNLHTGLSPYVKGGPNCTNWCIATRQFHLIGNTVMWIDSGIDTGNVLSTEFTVFNGQESLSEVHLKVMDHAHELYLKAIEFLQNGKTSSIKQSEIGEGKTYYTRDWTLKEKRSLIRNFRSFENEIRSGETERRRKTIRVIGLSDTPQ